jgi:hypothetical protein
MHSYSALGAGPAAARLRRLAHGLGLAACRFAVHLMRRHDGEHRIGHRHEQLAPQHPFPVAPAKARRIVLLWNESLVGVKVSTKNGTCGLNAT